MAVLAVKKGETKALPGGGGTNTFVGGLGWDEGTPGGDKIDLDLWVLRYHAGNTNPDIIAWANAAFARPDLGSNSEGNPWLATPELDVVHQGDDRTGAVAQSGYDETVTIDLSKTPADVESYKFLVSYYEDPDTGSGKTLGMATNIVCGFKDTASGHELQAPVESNHGFDVTAHVATLSKGADGKWSLTNDDIGYSEDAVTVVTKHFGFVNS